MPTEYKVSFILDQSTAPETESPASVRDGGWTENYYLSAATLGLAVTRCHFYCDARAALLAKTGQVNGFRIAERTSTGVARAYPAFRTGANVVCDVPQMAIQIHLRTATSKRTAILPGVPDIRSIGGAFSKSRTWENHVEHLIGILTAGFGMMALDKTQPLLNLISITTGGLVTTATPHGYVANDQIRFFRTSDIYRQTVTGTWIVSGTPPSTTTFQLANYASAGDVVFGPVNKGKVRKLVYAFSGFSEGDMGQITTRKVGRPFDLYRGRASRRRR